MVDSVDQINISGESLRVIHTKQINSSSSSFEFGGSIIERVGANSMFPSFFACDPAPGSIRCYSDGVIDYKTISFSCDATHVGLKEKDLNSINVSPNPFINHFIISTDQGIESLTLTNLKGQNILFEQKGNEIYPHNCSKGIYILSFEPNGNVYQRKLIK